MGKRKNRGDPGQPARCAWVWGVSDWFPQSNECGLGEDCTKPGFDGTNTGQVEFTDCSVND